MSALEHVVDVGITTRGEPAYLAEAIECVLGQKFTSWRLTISENGTGTEFIATTLEPYLRDPRMSHVVIGEDIGGAGNATALVQNATGRYVGILHDDDRWAPEFLERRVAFLNNHPSCGLVFSATDFIDPSGNVLYRAGTGSLVPGLQDRRAFLRELYRLNMIATPSALVPRACYEAVGPAYDGSVLFHDYEMWLRLAARFDIGLLPGCDVNYRIHPSQKKSGRPPAMGRAPARRPRCRRARPPARLSAARSPPSQIRGACARGRRCSGARRAACRALWTGSVDPQPSAGTVRPGHFCRCGGLAVAARAA